MRAGEKVWSVASPLSFISWRSLGILSYICCAARPICPGVSAEKTEQSARSPPPRLSIPRIALPPQESPAFHLPVDPGGDLNESAHAGGPVNYRNGRISIFLTAPDWQLGTPPLESRVARCPFQASSAYLDLDLDLHLLQIRYCTRCDCLHSARTSTGS
jgi:hypothetical protein